MFKIFAYFQGYGIFKDIDYGDIFLSVYLKGIWDTCLFALRDMEY